MKEAVVRKMFNEFDRKKKANDYDIITLTNDIEEHTEKINLFGETKTNLEGKLQETKDDTQKLNEENDKLLNSKITVDVTLTTLNPTNLEDEIETLTNNGIKLKEKFDGFATKISEIGVIEFDEDLHYKCTTDLNKTNSAVQIKEADIERLSETIEDLIAGGICKSCNRKLDNVDNTEHIEKHKEAIKKAQAELKKFIALATSLTEQLKSLNATKKLVDEKNKLELDRDRMEVDMGSLRNKIKDKKNDLKKYKTNESAIELNRNIDGQVSIIKTKLRVNEHTKDDLIGKIQKTTQEIETNKTNIETKTKLIEQIKKEGDIEKIYKVYIE
jgi:DNA repair exonuclease SbcCD ATPase subunit